MRVADRLAHIPGRVAHFGGSFAFMLAFVIFALMFLSMMADGLLAYFR